LAFTFEAVQGPLFLMLIKLPILVSCTTLSFWRIVNSCIAACNRT